MDGEQTTDDVVRATRPTPDDKAFRDQRRRRRTRYPGPEPAGDCCETCAHWIAPEREKDRYGQCRFLACAKRPFESIVIETRAAMTLAMNGWSYEPLRTAPGYACRGWKKS